MEQKKSKKQLQEDMYMAKAKKLLAEKPFATTIYLAIHTNIPIKWIIANKKKLGL